MLRAEHQLLQTVCRRQLCADRRRLGDGPPPATAPYGVFDNAGQDCWARSRILVQRNVYGKSMELLGPAVKGVAVGDPAARGTEMGPLVSRKH